MRKLTALLTILVLCLGTFAFARGQNDESAQSAADGPQKLVVWCQGVHQQVADGSRGGAGIDKVKEFEEMNNVKIEWVSIPWEQMQNKILRELALPKSEIDVVFIIQDWATPKTFSMLEDLDSYNKADPIENFDDIAQGMVSFFKPNGVLKAVPYRSNIDIFHYNKGIFQERGITVEPKTMEDVINIAKKTTYKRSDGAQVYGLGIKAGNAEDIIGFIRAFGGGVLTNDFKILCTKPETIKAIEILKELYSEGVIPPNFTDMGTQEYQNLVSEGLIAQIIWGGNYHYRFTSAESSKVADDMWFTYLPASKDSGMTASPSKAAFWGVGLPKNSVNKDRELAWKFIKFFTSQESQLAMALNGNGPCRVSSFDDKTFQDQVPYAEVTKTAVSIASPHLPPFNGMQEVADLFQEESTMAILGMKDVKTAMEDAKSAIEVILKREGLD